MYRTYHFTTRLLPIVLIALLAGCANIALTKKPPAKGGADGQQSGGPPSMTGDWRLAFQFNDQTLNSTMHLVQNGQGFNGDGEDTENGLKFKVEQGVLRGDQVTFFKKYANSPAVEYTGKLEVVTDGDYHGPMMSGEYTAAAQGKIISNQWQADMDLASNNPAPPPDQQQQQQQQEQPPPAQAPDHPPDLSGKWKCGYEYNFKTVKSTMFLEQDGSKITGHGLDVNTKEPFVIEKGWYKYPSVTIIRKYNKAAPPKGKPAPAGGGGRTMIFKADVTWINEADYQGPYLHGKTSGGGEWEAQQIK